MPSFPAAVPDLDAVLQADGTRPERYAVLADVAATMTNLGHPGYANAATDEVLSAGLIPAMFAKAATGERSSEEALDDADRAIRLNFEKWQNAGKI
jgi:multiple sugar transport system substrate-binding protein